MTELKKINVLSSAKISGVIGVIIGLILGIITALIRAIAGPVFDGARAGLGLEFLYIIIFPVIYGIGGFIFGVLNALIYNIIAKWIGGIELEFKG